MMTSHEAFCLDSHEEVLLWWDDFLGAALKDEWTESGDAGGSTVLRDELTGGVVRITTAGLDTNTWRIDWGDIRSLYASKRVGMEVRASLSTVSKFDLVIRLDNSDTRFIAFQYQNPNVPATNWEIRAWSAAGDTGGLDTGVLGDTDWHIFRIECHTHGGSHVHFYIDGVETGNSPIATNITVLQLQPYIHSKTREDAAKYSDVDYVAVRQDR